MKTKKQKLWRHGEIGLLQFSKLPKGLKASASKTLMVGSHGNNHSFDNGTFYPHTEKDNPFIFGYLKAKNTNLIHSEHKDKSGKAKIPDGVYQLLKQQEFTPAGLVPIID